MQDSGGALVPRDPTLGDGLEVASEMGAFGIPVLKPVNPHEQVITSSLSPREIKIPVAPSVNLPVVDPKVVSGNFK